MFIKKYKITLLQSKEENSPFSSLYFLPVLPDNAASFTIDTALKQESREGSTEDLILLGFYF